MTTHLLPSMSRGWFSPLRRSLVRTREWGQSASATILAVNEQFHEGHGEVLFSATVRFLTTHGERIEAETPAASFYPGNVGETVTVRYVPSSPADILLPPIVRH